MIITEPFTGFCSKTQQSWRGANIKHLDRHIDSQHRQKKRSSNLAMLAHLTQVKKMGMKQGECVGILHKDFWIAFSAHWETNL